MKTIDIVETGNGQSVPLPEEFRFATPTVSIRRQGDAVILEPVKSGCWPDHFFEKGFLLRSRLGIVARRYCCIVGAHSGSESAHYERQCQQERLRHEAVRP